MSITGAKESYFSIDNVNSANPSTFIVMLDLTKKADVESLLPKIQAFEDSNNYLNLYKINANLFEIHLVSDGIEDKVIIYNVPTTNSTNKDILTYLNSQEKILVGFSFEDGSKNHIPGMFKVQFNSIEEIE